MRVRTYGLLLLCLVSIAPLGIYGALAVQRSQHTSVAQVRAASKHLARAVAEMVRDHIAQQHVLVATRGAATLHADDPVLAHDAFELDETWDHFHHVVVYAYARRGHELEPVAGQPPPGREAEHLALARHAVDADSIPLHVQPMEKTPRIGHTMAVAAPVRIAGALEGVIVAYYDLVGLWQVIGSVRVERTGFIRLISDRGDTIAHGHPDKRDDVFRNDRDSNLSLLEAARSSRLTTNVRGAEIAVSPQPVDSLRWRDDADRWHVLVEQSVDEAFAESENLKRALVIVGLSVLLVVVCLGLLIGRTLVRALERMRTHASRLPGNLDSRLASQSALAEVRELADAIDRMAGDLAREREDARRRERLATFARVAAGLAHDLRLPIEAVHGACEAVNTAPDDPGAHAFLRAMSERELPRLRRFVDDLQRLARKGSLALEAERVDPRSLIDDIRAEMENARKWRGVRFESRGRARAIMLDHHLVRRAVLNLASNAADACLARGQGQEVTLEVADAGEGAIEIRVIDTGTGIAPDHLALIERGDFHSTKRSTGVGLGLSVVRHVADAHAGALLVASGPDQGTTFTLQLQQAQPPS